MTAPNMGFRVRMKIQRPDKDLLEKFAGYPTGNIIDAMNRTGAMDYRVKPLDSGWKMVGTALTVKIRPRDNLIVYKALEIAQPGDVLVIATDHHTATATWGDLTSMIGQEKKLGGMVTDGVIRDITGNLEVGFPVFATGVTPNSPWKDGPGEINFPVTCGGITVFPGDIIIGDADGVIVVPQADAEYVASKLPGIREKEEKTERNIRNGKYIPEWVEKTLQEKGCQIIED